MKPLDEIPESLDRVVPLGEKGPKVCPKCEGGMELGRVDEQFVLLCQACQGLLIQSQVFSKVIQQRRRQYTGPDATPEPIDPRQMENRIKCPECGELMDVHPYHGPGNSVIDSCARCSLVFLDYGELSDIERAPGTRDLTD